jgi:hypothetical protein
MADKTIFTDRPDYPEAADVKPGWNMVMEGLVVQ